MKKDKLEILKKFLYKIEKDDLWDWKTIIYIIQEIQLLQFEEINESLEELLKEGKHEKRH